LAALALVSISSEPLLVALVSMSSVAPSAISSFFQWPQQSVAVAVAVAASQPRAPPKASEKGGVTSGRVAQKKLV